MVSVETLEAFVKWLEDNNHDPKIVSDHGDESIECSNDTCLAGEYDWWSTHLSDYLKEVTG